MKGLGTKALILTVMVPIFLRDRLAARKRALIQATTNLRFSAKIALYLGNGIRGMPIVTTDPTGSH